MIETARYGLMTACLLGALPAAAQTPANLAVLRGLSPLASLPTTLEGRTALAANLAVTVGIQSGAIRQPTLLPFAAQQQQALRDAYITDGNLVQLADGLGTTLGAAYQARAHYKDRTHFTSVSPALANLIAYANSTTGSDSNSGKYFFANGTTDGKTAVSADAAALAAKGSGGDVFGRTYNHPAGSPGNDAFGNSRPFQVHPDVVAIVGPDYFNMPADNAGYNRGPIANLVDSPSFPSGHTTYGYMGSILLSVLVPQRYQQMQARGAEYGNDRILMGAHYAMDVIGGRTVATYDLAHLLANDPAYLGRAMRNPATSGGATTAMTDFRAMVQAAQTELAGVLQAGCGEPVAACAAADTGRFADPMTNEAFYATTLTYGLPVVHAATANGTEDVGQLAPEAGYLLTVAFPFLSLDQANRILTETEAPGGGFLDDGSGFGVYSRLNLYAAAGRAAAMAPK